MPNPEGGFPQGLFHCGSCMETVPEAQRRSMHCGWLPRERWSADRSGLPPAFGPDAYEVDVCPGWLVRQPAVMDGAQAYAALDAGALDLFDPLGLNIVWEMAIEAKRSFNLYRDAQEKIRAGRLQQR